MSLRRIAALCLLVLSFVGGCSRSAPPAVPVTTTVTPPAASEQSVPSETAAEQPAVQVAESMPVEQTAEKPATTDVAETADTPKTKPAANDPTPEESQPESGAPKLSRKELLKKSRSGVVLVTIYDALGEKSGFGSGCVIAPGLVLTNYHVVENAVTAQIQLRGEGDERLGTEVDVNGYRVLDEHHDLAVLEVDGLPDSVHVLPLADPEMVGQFDEVFAIGHPDGLKFSTSPGFVNGILKTTDLPEQFQRLMRSQETEWIQTDAVIAGGSSGGPLLNEAGEIVGINTFRLTNRAGLAVGARHVRELLATLPEHTEVSKLPVPNSDVLVTKAVAELHRGYAREFQQFTEDVQRARGNPVEMQKLIRRNNPGPACLQLCRDLVRSHPGQQEAVDALRLSSTILSANNGRLTAGRRYLDELLRDAAADAQLVPPSPRVVHALEGLPYSADLARYLRGVIEQGTEPAVQAAAGVILIRAMSESTTPRMPAETMELARQIYDRFADERIQGTTVRETLQTLIDSQQFAIGSLAPDIQGADEKGEKFRLSDYRGKVVVLDFWADWCPHCRNLYPHERELVERLKDKPFALLGVNGDEPDRAKRVIAAGTVTWRSWLDGSGGPIAEQYKIEGWPTIYVLDREGRIRFEGIRGEELDAAVNSLLGDSDKSASSDVVASGADWKYRPSAAEVDVAAWIKADFDDAGWQSGAGPFGFGPISAATALELGEPGRRTLTTLFRKTFDLPAGELPAQLLMKLRYADGVVVSLNGEEIYRDRLLVDSTWESPAIFHATERETLGVSLLIDSSKLKPTQNCLAVELHLASPYRAEALFDLSLGHPPDFASLGNDLGEARKAELCVLLSQIGVGLPGSRELMEKWQSDDSPEVQIRAAITAGMYDLPVTMAELSDPEAQRSFIFAMLHLNQSAWEAVTRADLSPDQYLLALRRAKAGCALFDKVPKELKPRVQGIFNTCGIALYRNQRWDEAKRILQDSLDKRGENPFDVAYLSLIARQAGDADAAQEQRRQFAKLLESDDWKHDGESHTVQQEMNRAFGEDR